MEGNTVRAGAEGSGFIAVPAGVEEIFRVMVEGGLLTNDENSLMPWLMQYGMDCFARLGREQSRKFIRKFTALPDGEIRIFFQIPAHIRAAANLADYLSGGSSLADFVKACLIVGLDHAQDKVCECLKKESSEYESVLLNSVRADEIVERMKRASEKGGKE